MAASQPSRPPPQGDRLTLVGDVALGAANAPLIYLGDWLGWASLAGYVFFMVFPTMEKRRWTGQTDPDEAALYARTTG